LEVLARPLLLFYSVCKTVSEVCSHKLEMQCQWQSRQTVIFILCLHFLICFTLSELFLWNVTASLYLFPCINMILECGFALTMHLIWAECCVWARCVVLDFTISLTLYFCGWKSKTVFCTLVRTVVQFKCNCIGNHLLNHILNFVCFSYVTEIIIPLIVTENSKTKTSSCSTNL
jgi:hypothetical protein